MSEELTPQDMRLNIHPGEWYFGNEYESLYTVLGSCVALSVWHPTLKLGGLCHYLLPVQPGQKPDQDNGGRYGKTALMLLKQAMQRYAALSEYQLGLFGGCDTISSNMSSNMSSSMSSGVSNYGIGKQNILFAQRWLQNEKLVVTQTDVGGTSSRSLIFELLTGVINVKHYALQLTATPP